MACGLPIIYSATGGIPELVGTGAGIGLPLEENWNSQPHSPDPELVSEAMDTVIYKKSEFAAFARERAVQYFDINNWINKHKEVFNVHLNK
jgi:glycosyltransferase involved in cell wall biosynthesis